MYPSDIDVLKSMPTREIVINTKNYVFHDVIQLERLIMFSKVYVIRGSFSQSIKYIILHSHLPILYKSAYIAKQNQKHRCRVLYELIS